jgi:ribosomal protein S18 acetylase RimI-like enzyme
MFIEEMTHVTQEIFNAFQYLIPQLTQNSPPPTMKDLVSMAESPHSFVFLAYENELEKQVIGSATLALFQTPTGWHGWIEDVIVDQKARRQGIGQALTRACIEKAEELELKEVNLTSRPTRKAANALYQAMGFKKRQTNVYRFPINESG